jgi:hypothetical protein
MRGLAAIRDGIKARGEKVKARRETKAAKAGLGVPAGRDTPVLKFMMFIIDWSKTKSITEILEESHVRFHFICKGRGTASSEVLDLLGIGSREKAVVICLEQDIMVPVLLKRASKSLGLNNPGAGIAFTVPLSGISKPILQVFKQSIHKNISAEEVLAEKAALKTAKKNLEEGKSMKQHDLIVIIVNHGYSDELMSCAREAGASGGTVLNARGLVHQGPVKFFGILVQDEKEIITILTGRTKKVPIMRAVSERYGMASKAQGIVFSLPAENITGLDLE